MSKYTLFIVDDEEDIRNSLKRNLKKWSDKNGISLKAAGSADDALEILHQEHDRTALIISDQKMPGRSGADFLKEVAARYPDIVTIMLTGHADTSDMGDFIEAGIYSFLEKPWDKTKLIMEVEKAFELYKLRRKTAEQEKLLQAELKMASDFQELFLEVHIPQSSCFQFDLIHQNAKQLSFGGDYYEILSLGEERYLLLLGDVAGHGLKASFLVAILKSIIYSEFIKSKNDSVISPADFLTKLNDRIHLILSRIPDLFLAFSACCIDGHTNKLSCANGGQPPLLIITENGVNESSPPQPALGFIKSFQYTETSHNISAGDIIFLCTDGVYPTGKTVRYIDKTLFYELLQEMRNNKKGAKAVLKTLALSEKSLLEKDDATILSVRLEKSI